MEYVPLNPFLYDRLRRAFGSVIPAVTGQSFVAGNTGGLLESRSVGYKPSRKSRPFVDIASAGEYYRVNCDRCNDTRHRLWINHMAHKYTYLVICYNEDCYAARETRKALMARLLNGRPPEQVQVKQGHRDSGQLHEVSMPETSRLITELPSCHPAVSYLRDERGYDLDYLVRYFRVGYCENSAQYPAVSNRIMIPIYMGGKLVGWQARLIGERYWKTSSAAKYYDLPGMSKRMVLYNHDIASQFPFVVIQEGVTDVWSTGPYAMALLGKSISYTQRRMLAFPPFRDKPIVLMLDGDAQEENRSITDEMKREHPGGVIEVPLADGCDPGQYSPAINLSLIQEAARAQKVALPSFSW